MPFIKGKFPFKLLVANVFNADAELTVAFILVAHRDNSFLGYLKVRFFFLVITGNIFRDIDDDFFCATGRKPIKISRADLFHIIGEKMNGHAFGRTDQIPLKNAATGWDDLERWVHDHTWGERG